MGGEQLDMKISQRAVDLILGFEGLDHGGYPGGASGVTWGHGWDSGYHTERELLHDWGGRVPQRVIDVMRRGIGVKGEAAAKLAGSIAAARIRIPVEIADAVFREVDLPRWINRARAALACYDKLPDDAQGALVSLTFNRGDSMGTKGQPSWDSRSEMRDIRDILARWCNGGAPQTALPRVLDVIAGAIRSMERLWVGKGLDGLITRRHAEAALVDAAAAEASAALAQTRVS